MCTKNPIQVDCLSESQTLADNAGADLFRLRVLGWPFKSSGRLEAENAALRHQVTVIRRQVHGTVRLLTNLDRLFLVQLYRWIPSVLKAVVVVQPETLVRWLRAGFRATGAGSQNREEGGRKLTGELRALIQRMSIDNPLWSAPRIHGELLKLGLEVAQSSVAKYMVKRRRPLNQGWGTFLRNHAPPRLLPWTCSMFRPLPSVCSMR